MTGRDLLLSVDLSGSMEEQDFQLNGQWVDRLTALKSVATDFIERRVGDRVGLILFGREAYLQAPLTFDRKTVSTLLDESVIGLAGKETAIGDSIGLAIRTLEDAGIERKPARADPADGRREHGRRRRAAQSRRARGAAQVGHLHDRHRRRLADGALAVRLARDQSVGRSRRGDDDGDRRDDGRPLLPRARHGRSSRRSTSILDELEPAESDERGFRPIARALPLAARRGRRRSRSRGACGLRGGALAMVARRARARGSEGSRMAEFHFLRPFVVAATAGRRVADLAAPARPRRRRRLAQHRRARLAAARARRARGACATAGSRSPRPSPRGSSRSSRSRARRGSACRCRRSAPTRRSSSRSTSRARWTPATSSRRGSRAPSSSCSTCSSGAPRARRRSSCSRRTRSR